MPAVEQGKARREGSIVGGLIAGIVAVAVASGFVEGGGSSNGNGNATPGTSAPSHAAAPQAPAEKHTAHAAPTPKTAKAVGGISFWGKAFKDGSGNVTVITCYGDPPQHATSFGELSGASPDSYNSGDTAGGVSCELSISTMSSDADAYAGVASIPVDGYAYITGTAEGNQALSTQQR